MDKIYETCIKYGGEGCDPECLDKKCHYAYDGDPGASEDDEFELAKQTEELSQKPLKIIDAAQ